MAAVLLKAGSSSEAGSLSKGGSLLMKSFYGRGPFYGERHFYNRKAFYCIAPFSGQEFFEDVFPGPRVPREKRVCLSTCSRSRMLSDHFKIAKTPTERLWNDLSFEWC
jgi:hypothetical protein